MTGYVAVVFRRVRPGCEAEFEAAMEEFARICHEHPGHVELRLLRDHQLDNAYTVVNSYRDEASRRSFTASPVYAQWMERLGEFTDGPPTILEHHGLRGFFPSPGQSAGPPRWKMAVVTWMAVWPTATLLRKLLGSSLTPLPELAQGAIFNAVVVAGLTWLVMPALTRSLRGWLFPQKKEVKNES